MKGIVVGFDGTEEGLDALRLADGLRAATGKEMILTVVDEHAPIVSDAGGYWEYQQNYFAGMAREAAEFLGHHEFSRQTASDSAPAALQGVAESEDADLIVLGSTHRGQVGRVLPGSVADDAGGGPSSPAQS